MVKFARYTPSSGAFYHWLLMYYSTGSDPFNYFNVSRENAEYNTVDTLNGYCARIVRFATYAPRVVINPGVVNRIYQLPETNDRDYKFIAVCKKYNNSSRMLAMKINGPLVSSNALVIQKVIQDRYWNDIDRAQIYTLDANGRRFVC